MPNEETYGVTFADEKSGNYQIFLRSGYKYKLVGGKEGYKPVEMSVTLENKDKPYTYDLNIFLSKELAETQPELVAEVMAIGVGIEKEESEEIDVEDSEQDILSEIDEVIATTEESEEMYDDVLSDYSSSAPEERSYITEEKDLRNLVVFNFDSEEIRSQSYPILDEIARFLVKDLLNTLQY